VKPSAVRKDDVLVRVRLGLGRLGMPRNRIDASDMGASIWSSGGLGKLTPAERARTLAGRRAAVSVETGEDAFELANGLGGATTTADFDLQMELMAAMVTDPGLRTQEWAGLMALSDRADEAFELTAGGVMGYNLPRMLHAGDLRWTYNTKAMRDSWKAEDAVAFIRPIILNSPMEVIVVGDITVDKAIADVGRTLGALPWRTMRAEPSGIRNVKFPKATAKPIVLTHKGRADQGGVVVAWPTQDTLSDQRGSRVGWVLSQMLRDEATRRFRTDSSATYSPVALTEFSDTLPGYGYVGLSLEIPPDKADAALAEIEAIAATLAKGPIWDSEVARIVGPRVEAVKRGMAGNDFWVAALSGAQADSRRLEAIRTLVSDYQAITAADVHAAAKRWLKPETAWKLKVVPEAKAR
jgi:zinc protease